MRLTPATFTRMTLLTAALLSGCGGTPPSASDGGTQDSGANPGGDQTPPTVISTLPANGALDVPVDSALAFEFSEEMDPSSLQVTTSPQVTFGAPEWSFGNTLVQLVPTSPLGLGVTYSVSVSAKDLAGNALGGVTSFTFTSAAVDNTAPELLSTTPANNATDVAVDATLQLHFSEAMNISSVLLAASPSITFTDPVWSDGDKTATFTATAPFSGNTAYTMTVSGADLAGNALGGTTSWKFTTGTPPDNTAPTVDSTSPGDGDVNVGTSSNLTVAFSEPMDRTSVETAFTVSPSKTCLFAWDTASTQVSCVLSSPMAYGTDYTVTIGTGAHDPAGNALASAHTFTFKTASAPDTTPPTIVSSDPANGEKGVVNKPTIVVTFSEPMNRASAQAAFTITNPLGLTGGTFSWNTAGTEMSYTVPTTLGYGTSVSWRVNTAATDVAGNPMTQSSLRSFRVAVTQTMTLYSLPTEDGTVGSDGSVQPSLAYIWAGDDTAHHTLRGFASFNLGGLPSTTVRIGSATLNVYQWLVSGTPYSTLGTLRAESITYGQALSAAAYGAPILKRQQCFGNVCIMVDDVYSMPATTTSGVKTVTVTAKVASDFANLASRSNRSQFRFAFTTLTDGDTANDLAYFYAGENGTLNYRPRLQLVLELAQ